MTARALATVWLAWSLHGAVMAATPDADTGISAFEDHVARLESSGGPYNPLLAEALGELGRAQREAGLHGAAAKSLERALHVARVNEGLHNPAHLPLLESLLDVHAALGDALAVDRDYQQIYWIRMRNAGADRAALLPLILEIGTGRLQAYAAAPAAAGMVHLVKADAIFDLARGIDEETGGMAGTALYYRAALVNHRLALEMRQRRVGFHDLRAALINNGRAVSEVNEDQARESLFTEFYLKGEWLAIQALARTGDAAPVARAEALRFLGDYYLSFRRNLDAMQEYRRALAVLEQHGLATEARRLFGAAEAVTLLRAPDDDGSADVAETDGGRYVDALLDVGADGWPGNVRVQRIHPAQATDLAARGARALLARHYRPRLVDGRPVPSADVPARYEFPH